MQNNQGSGNTQQNFVLTFQLRVRREILPPVRRFAGRLGGWRPRGWVTWVGVVALPVAGVAVARRPGTGIHDLVAVALVAAPLMLLRLPERMFRWVAVVALLLLAGVLVPLPAAGANTCGVARIAVDKDLLPGVQMLFAAAQSRLERDQDCVASVEFAALDRDVHTGLRVPETPVAGVITADPGLVRGIAGDWDDLTVRTSAVGTWRLLGREPATVFLDDRRYHTEKAVSLPELARRGTVLAVRDVSPLDPVATAVLNTPGRPEISSRTVDLTDEESCRNVVLPPGPASACSGAALWLEDGDGTVVGADVLAVPFTAAEQLRSGDAAHAFLAWLDRAENRKALGLADSTQSPAEAVAKARVLAPAPVLPLDVTIVVDSSRSMSAGERGGTPPWTAAREAVLRWAGRRALSQGDRLTVVLARTGDGDPARRTVTVPGEAAPGLRLPATEPGGETGLVQALARAGATDGKTRRVVVLLTDGVNALTEQPVPRADRSGLDVVVIGGGCSGQPGWARKHCRGTDSNSDHVADRLTALIEER